MRVFVSVHCSCLCVIAGPHLLFLSVATSDAVHICFLRAATSDAAAVHIYFSSVFKPSSLHLQVCIIRLKRCQRCRLHQKVKRPQRCSRNRRRNCSINKDRAKDGHFHQRKGWLLSGSEFTASTLALSRGLSAG